MHLKQRDLLLVLESETYKSLIKPERENALISGTHGYRHIDTWTHIHTLFQTVVQNI